MSGRPVLKIARADGRRPLVFSWGVSSFFGWGIYGLNLILALADHPRFAPFCAIPFAPGDTVLDPLRSVKLAPAAAASAQLWEALGRTAGAEIGIDAPVLLGLGRGLATPAAAHNKMLSGNPAIGVAFLEETRIDADARRRGEQFPLIVAGSSWNEKLLRAGGLTAVTTVLQGVDTALHHPAPKAGLFPGRFVIFSGGKLELRKGQDLVLAAFRAFRQRHQEALLVCAWHSPWSELAATAAAHPGITAPRPAADGTPDVTAWAVENGVPADAVVAVGRTPNIAMPHVVREADVALFPNRCEGGTNLVAMECMACGIPVILSANTGHLDLLRGGGAMPLERQMPVSHRFLDTTDWGESDVEEMVEKLELVWRDRAGAATVAARGAEAMARLTWRGQIEALMQATGLGPDR
jgi:glycosyltransferase involved in cell wall biosynthesis